MQLRNTFLTILSTITLLFSPSAQAETFADIPRIELLSGVSLPETIFFDKNNKPVTLVDFIGKPLIINFWASWCAPCVTEMPALIALQKKLEPHNSMQLLTISEDFKGLPTVLAFIQKHQLDIANPFIDNNNHLMNALDISSLPTTIFVDKNGIIRGKIHGVIDWSNPSTVEILKTSF